VVGQHVEDMASSARTPAVGASVPLGPAPRRTLFVSLLRPWPSRGAGALPRPTLSTGFRGSFGFDLIDAIKARLATRSCADILAFTRRATRQPYPQRREGPLRRAARPQGRRGHRHRLIEQVAASPEPPDHRWSAATARLVRKTDALEDLDASNLNRIGRIRRLVGS